MEKHPSLHTKDAIDDWRDITELDGEKRGPALRNRLEGDGRRHLQEDPGQGCLEERGRRRNLLQEDAAILCERQCARFLYRFQPFRNLRRGSSDLMRWMMSNSVETFGRSMG